MAGALDVVVHVLELPARQFSPVGTDRCCVTEAVQKDFDFSKGEVHFGGEANQEHTVQGIGRITPLAADAMWWLENAYLFIIANGGWFQASAFGEFANLHLSSLSATKKGFDLKSTLGFSIRTCQLQIPLEVHMDLGKKLAAVAGTSLAALTMGAASKGYVTHESVWAGNQEKQIVKDGGKFFCNTKALPAAERARHAQLTEKLMSVRKEVVETEKGYEFQYSPADISIVELADWVASEGKCCPFFDFHLDLEREGALLCLRLTGAEGVKAFIRSEFQMPQK